MPRRIWMLLREPRVVTAATAGAWLCLTIVGATALNHPPVSIAYAIGPILVRVWAACLLAAGVLGLAGCLSKWWWIERLGLIAAWTGLGIYEINVVILHVTSAEGNRWPQAGVILALILVLIPRWHRISGAQVDPTTKVAGP